MTDRRASARADKPQDPSIVDPTRPSHWYMRQSGADHPTRRRHVWGLLGWWNDTVTIPNQGLGGMLRRLYLRIFGDRLRVPMWDPQHPPAPDQLHLVRWKRVNVSLEKFRAPHRALHYRQLIELWDIYQQRIAAEAAEVLHEHRNGAGPELVEEG